MATRKSKMTWAAPVQNTDGSVFDQSQFAGFTLKLDGVEGISIPRGWDTDGEYEMDLVAIDALAAFGTHTVQMAVVNKAGTVGDYTAPLTYSVVDDRKPKAPFDLAVS